ncbi:MAG TPA: murein biosynthesis integral membrane protein MurJ [Abditibacteriaceae bacterium]
MTLEDSSPSETEAPRRKRGISPLQAAMVLAATIFLSRIIGLVQLRIINATLSPEARDAYFAAFRLPDAVNYLIAGGAMSVTFIPIFVSLKERDSREAWRFFSTVASLMSVVLVALLTLCFLLANPLVRVMNPGFDARKLDIAVQMTRVLLPAQLFFYLGGMMVGVLNAHRRFGASGMTSAVYNTVAIAVGLALWLMLGDIGFAWGITVGALCGSFLLPLVAALQGPREQRLQFQPSFDWRLPSVQTFFRNALPIMLGVSLPVVDQQIVGIFASYLPDGHLSYLQNGNRAMLAPLGILAQAASVAAFPFMAGDSANKDWPALADFMRSGLRRLMFLALPISMLLILNATPIIKILFGSQSFLLENKGTALPLTALAFAWYCAGLFAWAGQQFVARGFYALQDTVTPTIIGSVLTIFFFIPLCWMAARWGGVAGLAIATSVGACAHFCGVLLALEAKLKRRPYKVDLGVARIWGTLLRTGAATLIMAAFGVVAMRISHSWSTLPQMLFITVPACMAFGFAARAFRIPEWNWVAGKIRAKLKR